MNEEIRLVLNELRQEAKIIQDKYPPTVKHFAKGDRVFYADPNGQAVPAIVDRVQEPNNSGEFIRYWIHKEENSSIWHKIQHWLLVNSKWLYFEYITFKKFPKHSMLPGDDIFSTKEEAEYALTVGAALYYVSEYFDQKTFRTYGQKYDMSSNEYNYKL